MEGKTTSYGYFERGGGGKFRKAPPRKPPSKPYDRPPSLASVTKTQSWFSKLVDPAKSLIGGATRILPSFFSTTLDTPDLIDDGDDREHDEEVVPSNSDDGGRDSNQAVITSFEGPHPNEVPESSKRFSEPVENGTGEQIRSSDKSEISRIEQLINGKTFSRDEIHNLIEILNSKTLDVHEAEWGTREIVTAAAVEHEGPLLTHQGRQEDNNRAITGTPLPQLKVGEEIGASPIDIAKAFMGSRNLDPCATPRNASAKAEDKLQLIESASKPLIHSPSPMSSPHWPGVMVADQRGYASPLSHKDRHGLHDFPRTPYSRTFYSNSRSKPLADSRYPSSSSNFFQKSRVPIYAQSKRSEDVRQEHGSLGPIRRMRSKFSSETRSRGSIFSKPLVEVPSGSKVLPVEKTLGPNETRNNSKHLPAGGVPSGSEEASSFLNPSTNQAVRRILEHMDRNKPTPRQKAAELERATAWRKSVGSVRFDDLGKETASVSHDNKADLVSKGNDGNTTSDVPVKFPEVAIRETKIAAQGGVLTSNLDGISGMRNPGGAKFPSHFDSISGSTAHNSLEQANNGMGSILQKETSKHQIDNGAQNHSFELSKRPVAEVTSSKPILSSIAISKPDPRRMASSGNGIGFTFPVSASFGVTSEPPTPSIMPSSSATMVSSLQTPVSTVPSYSFGSKRTSPPLVFSFPGGGIPSSDDTSDLKFDFGSNENSRLSFKSIGKGAICS